MLLDTLTIVGVGLIGGSIGRAAKARRAARRVLGVGRDAEFLELAQQHGAIDEYTTNLAEAFAVADLVVVCTPVDQIASVIRSAPIRDDAVITDAGSTKGELAAALAAIKNYVGSHPLAGSEKAGVKHARGDLFDGKMVVVVPNGDEAMTGKVEAFWQSLGARTARMTAVEHDAAVAYTSHLPHLVASAVARCLPPGLLPLAASGFKDTTRVAAGDPALWNAILQSNREAVLAALAAFRGSIDDFETWLRAADGPGLIRWLDEGKQVRDALGD